MGDGGKEGLSDAEVWDDPRLRVVDPEWLAGRRCLDVGCNGGYVAISLGERFGAELVVGVDIDKLLIKRAKKMLKDRAAAVFKRRAREEVDREAKAAEEGEKAEEDVGGAGKAKAKAKAPDESEEGKEAQPMFPSNVVFKTEDFVLGDHPHSEYHAIFW